MAYVHDDKPLPDRWFVPIRAKRWVEKRRGKRGKLHGVSTYEAPRAELAGRLLTRVLGAKPGDTLAITSPRPGFLVVQLIRQDAGQDAGQEGEP